MIGTMKALSKLRAEPGIWMVDVPLPVCGHNDVIVKIKKTAVCGTDIHIYNWDDWAKRTIPVPMVTGHEFVGEVVEVGCEVKELQIGDRVSGEGHITCGYCRNCRAGVRHLCRNTLGTGVNRTGCFSEYIVFPAFNLFKLPDGIPDNLAAIFDPFGNAAHTALSFDLVGEDVLITGAGPVGIMAAAIARHVGARHVVITDINEYRLGLARTMGATHAIDPTKTDLAELMKEIGIKEGFDVGLEMSHIALLGLIPNQTGINWDNVIFKGLNIKGIYGREMFGTWYKMVSMLQSGLDISPIITHEFSIDQFEQGFQTMLSGKSGKVILNWS